MSQSVAGQPLFLARMSHSCKIAVGNRSRRKSADLSMSYGVLLLRLALGTMFIAHSVVYMLLTLTLAGTVKFFASIGLPPWIAYATILAEALGGLFLILGIQTRWVALALSPILIGAVWVHSGNGWLFASPDGGWEYPLYLFVLCVAQAMLGDGPYAISPSWFPGERATVKSNEAALRGTSPTQAR